jgi:predicted transcriptional regulator
LSSNGSDKKGKMVDWRRNKVQQLLVRGYSQWDVAEELQIDQSTVSRDIQYLRQQAQENLHKHIQQKLPEEYQHCLSGMNQVLKLSWQIANNITSRQYGQDHNDNIDSLTTGDVRTRLQALSLINDCYKYIMDLTTNGVVITDAIKFVQTNKEKLTAMSSKEDNGSKESEEPDYDEDKDQLEEEQEEEKGEKETTNQVF